MGFTHQALFTVLLVFMLFSGHTYTEECAGCPIPANLSDPMVQKYAQDAVAEIKKETNHMSLYYLEEIINATVQVVAGILYHYELIVLRTDLYEGLILREKDLCNVDVWVKEWEDFENITVNSCERQFN
ncbi:hypothetical protein L9F63_025778 [Diploptera punctata]|uniref:Cystatin domain-containing protein n=1 Tax=Diploptera punctata TaxID=6984 RepID=A0AAD7Z6U5_DIPPU|nr:hypothetical protein L9F63_025778 [Diploptera punctata]